MCTLLDIVKEEINNKIKIAFFSSEKFYRAKYAENLFIKSKYERGCRI